MLIRNAAKMRRRFVRCEGRDYGLGPVGWEYSRAPFVKVEMKINRKKACTFLVATWIGVRKHKWSRRERFIALGGRK